MKQSSLIMKMEATYSPKSGLTFSRLHGIISQKIVLFITTAVRTSDPTFIKCCPQQSIYSITITVRIVIVIRILKNFTNVFRVTSMYPHCLAKTTANVDHECSFYLCNNAKLKNI
jgi:hypothetical protein